MRFNNIDIHSSNDSGLTELMRKESSHIIDMYFRLLKFYDNGNCKNWTYPAMNKPCSFASFPTVTDISRFRLLSAKTVFFPYRLKKKAVFTWILFTSPLSLSAHNGDGIWNISILSANRLSLAISKTNGCTENPHCPLFQTKPLICGQYRQLMKQAFS